MPKAKGKKSHFNYIKNRSKLGRRKKKTPFIENEHIRKAWDPYKSAKENFKIMGICYDPNSTIPIPNPKKMMNGDMSVEEMDIDEAKTTAVLQKFQAEVDLGSKKIPPYLSEDDQLFCIYLLETHGYNYKSMTLDKKNVYQLTKKQIIRLIEKFKSNPAYETYMQKKKDGTLDMTIFQDN